jgi:hypothetical protein
MASNTLERKCAIRDDIFNEFLLSVKILFRRLRSCFNIILEFISVRFSKFCCLWPTRLDRVRISRRADRLILGFLRQIELWNPQHGQISVITAHFKPAESFTCFKCNKISFYVSYNKLSGMLLWDLSLLAVVSELKWDL